MLIYLIQRNKGQRDSLIHEFSSSEKTQNKRGQNAFKRKLTKFLRNSGEFSGIGKILGRYANKNFHEFTK